MAKRLVVVLLFLALVCGDLAGCSSVENGAIQVGAASATVNPPNGAFLAGYDTNRRSTGVHDDLYAKAVVFHDGESAVALVVLDGISIQYDTASEIRRAASRAVSKITLPPERIIVQATHTHCAPDTIGIYGPDETHTGETAPLYSNETKALMKSGPKFVLGLALDHLGYICPPNYFGNANIKFADYLTGMSPGPKAGAAMMDALKSIIP